MNKKSSLSNFKPMGLYLYKIFRYKINQINSKSYKEKTKKNLYSKKFILYYSLDSNIDSWYYLYLSYLVYTVNVANESSRFSLFVLCNNSHYMKAERIYCVNIYIIYIYVYICTSDIWVVKC